MNNDRLKFRVWSIKHNCYQEYCSFDLTMEGRLIDGAGNTENNGREDLIIEQCTGLKDKNGNLIYEGDLVKIPDDWDEYGWMAGEVREIYYKDGGFRFKPKEASIKRGERGHWLEDDGCYEIVGNIHERKDKQ